MMSFLPILNIINGLSNFPVIYVIHSSLQQGDRITAGVSLFVGLGSLFSHLGENHKHNLPGILGLTHHQSYLLNRIDVLGATLTFMRSLMIYYNSYGLNLYYFYINPNFTKLLLLAGTLNLISERVPIIANNPLLFTMVHSTWHIMSFTLLNYFLNNN